MQKINKIVYEILKTLRDSMSADEFDARRLDPDRLGTDKNTRDALLVMLLSKGYISGLEATQYVGETRPTINDLQYTKITLDGLEYFEENKWLRKAAKQLKGTK